MNAPPLSASPVNARSTGELTQESIRGRAGRSWLFSITGVCFVFGALVAMQLRATQQLNAEAARKQEGAAQAERLATEMRKRADASEKQTAKLKAQLVSLQKTLATGTSLSKSQVAALGSQIKDLQNIAGLTPIQGPGIRIVLSDNPDAAQGGLGNTAFLPGLVHDYDLLQVVNELRLNKADAIAIQGAGGEAIRVTGYTPIRCVGSPIMVNWQTVTAPFTIEAIGDPRSLRSAMEMPGGIVDNLRTNGAIGVKVTQVGSLQLPAATDIAPKLRVAKSSG